MGYGTEKRASQRIPVEVPVRIDQETAVSRDVGWSGIYFLSNLTYPKGETLKFALDLSYALPGKPVSLDCQGEVVRVEQHGRRYGIAAKILSFHYPQ